MCHHLVLPMRRMMQLWEIGLLGVAASERGRREVNYLCLSIQSWQSKGVVGVRALGREQGLLVKSQGLFGGSASGKAIKLCSFWAHSVENIGACHVHTRTVASGGYSILGTEQFPFPGMEAFSSRC